MSVYVCHVARSLLPHCIGTVAPVNVDWGSAPEWFAGVATSGTLVIATVLVVLDRRKQETLEADQLRATLDLDGDDFASPSPLSMTITNHGNTTFWEVTVYRCAHVSVPGEADALKWYRAELPYVDARTRYKWTVFPEATLLTGQNPHPRSFETFVHRGIFYARYRRKPLRRVSRSSTRDLNEQRREFDQEHNDAVIVLKHDNVKICRDFR
jgi:hypothetical protein